MLKFTEAGSVRKISGTDFWLVDDPFVWYIIYGGEEHVVVPAGFKTNFGSIPRVFWWIMNPTEWNAYVLHDYLYSTQYKNDKVECDYILYEALVAEGCGKITASIVFIALYLFGGKAWRAYNKKTI